MFILTYIVAIVNPPRCLKIFLAERGYVPQNKKSSLK